MFQVIHKDPKFTPFERFQSKNPNLVNVPNVFGLGWSPRGILWGKPS